LTQLSVQLSPVGRRLEVDDSLPEGGGAAATGQPRDFRLPGGVADDVGLLWGRRRDRRGVTRADRVEAAAPERADAACRRRTPGSGGAGGFGQNREGHVLVSSGRGSKPGHKAFIMIFDTLHDLLVTCMAQEPEEDLEGWRPLVGVQ
jgi:hypothetical protein